MLHFTFIDTLWITNHKTISLKLLVVWANWWWYPWQFKVPPLQLSTNQESHRLYESWRQYPTRTHFRSIDQDFTQTNESPTYSKTLLINVATHCHLYRYRLRNKDLGISYTRFWSYETRLKDLYFNEVSLLGISTYYHTMYFWLQP